MGLKLLNIKELVFEWEGSLSYFHTSCVLLHGWEKKIMADSGHL